MPKTCIVIDDDRSFLLVIRAMIEKMTWIDLIDFYDNPIRGATAVIQQQPSILITDYKMPYMNGTDLIDWLSPQLSMMEKVPKTLVLSANEELLCNKLSLADGFLCKKDILKDGFLEEKLAEVAGLQLT